VTRREDAFAQMNRTLVRMAEVECLRFQHAPYTQEPFCIPRGSMLDANGNFRGDILVQRALVEERDYLPRQATVQHPHFINYVQAVLELQFGPDEIFRRGFQVRTTLNSDLQDEALTALQDQLRTIAFTGVNTGTVMVVDPTDGAIRAMVGSPDFNNEEIGGQINFALTWQQPGSAIKPIVYTGALEGVGDRNLNGVLDYSEYLTAASVLWDVPTTYSNPTYTPVNFDARFRGPVSVRYALANSLNVPAVKAYQFIGNDKFVEISRRLGLTFLTDPPQVGLPSAVGATEARLYDMMQAYATLANSGRRVPMYAIVSITDIDGNPVTLEARTEPVQAAQAEHAYLIQNILSDNTARADTFGLNSPLVISGLPADRVAAKTGTSNDARDLWTMGFTRNMVVGVWLGRADNNPTRGSAIDHAASVWNRTMQAALRTVPAPQAFVGTGNIVQQVICNLTGTLPSDNCTSRRNELFVSSQPPPPADQGVVVTVPIDTWTGFRANQSCPENVENRVFVNIGDPYAVQWLASTGQAIAAQLGLPNPPQSPPAQACDVNTQLPTARILSPTSGQVLQNVVQIQGVAAGQNFDRYQLAYAPQGTNNFTLIAPATATQVPNQGVLGQWDTRTVPNGVYTLRLEMFANATSGGGYLRRDVPVSIQNIIPTNTPTATWTPQPILPTSTTVPFPTLDNTILQPTQPVAPLGAPTPTATINVGG
jgi:membrane carboxypeptidase/penicillin-binding protein PbpC